MTKKNLNETTETVTEEQTETVKTEEKTLTELDIALKQVGEFKDLAQRVQAEFDNFRRRNAEAVKNARTDGADEVIMALLAVMDNFERGIQALEDSAKTGVELIYKQVMGILEKFDVKEIEALGVEFNPAYHHAIARCDDSENANVIVEVFQKGYIRKNKVLRPSMVKVAQ